MPITLRADDSSPLGGHCAWRQHLTAPSLPAVYTASRKELGQGRGGRGVGGHPQGLSADTRTRGRQALLWESHGGGRPAPGSPTGEAADLGESDERGGSAARPGSGRRLDGQVASWPEVRPAIRLAARLAERRQTALPENSPCGCAELAVSQAGRPGALTVRPVAGPSPAQRPGGRAAVRSDQTMASPSRAPPCIPQAPHAHILTLLPPANPPRALSWAKLQLGNVCQPPAPGCVGPQPPPLSLCAESTWRGGVQREGSLIPAHLSKMAH